MRLRVDVAELIQTLSEEDEASRGGERCKSEAKRENDREPDQPYGRLGGEWLAWSLANAAECTSTAPHEEGAVTSLGTFPI